MESGGPDWWEWHKPMDDPSSALSRRLVAVQEALRRELDGHPSGPIRVISLCGGQGRDLIEVLAGHPRKTDVRARLVEIDPRNVTYARASAAAAHLVDYVEIVEADAGITDAYAEVVPADIVLSCGLFGNITGSDIERTIHAFPTLCSTRGVVIWTRNRLPPDLTPKIRTWFQEAGFEEESFTIPAGTVFAVGAHRLVREPQDFTPGYRLFDFVGYNQILGKPDR
jgi:Putative methyltransferase